MSHFSSLRGGRARKFKAEINVVPYIDVMMVLLVIFMVSAPLTNPSVINLPHAAKSSNPPTDYIEITLKPESQASIRINSQKNGSSPNENMSASTLTQRLQTLHLEQPDLPVMISAEKDIKYDEVIQIISEAKMLGITRVGLATK